MKRKNIILGVLAVLCLLGTGSYAWILQKEYDEQVLAWKEEAKASFEEALWMEVDKRSDIPFYHSSSEEQGITSLRTRIPDSVSVMTANGFRKYKIDGEKYEKSLIKETIKRGDLGILLEESFLGLDNIKSELVRWQLNKDKNQMLRGESIKLDKATFRAVDFVPYRNGSFLIPNYSGDTRFCQVDGNGKLIQKWGEIPTDKPKLLKQNTHAFGQGWHSFIDYNPKSGILVAATQLGEVLEIWDIRKGTHQVIKGKLGDPKFEISQSYAIPSGVRGYNDIHLTDRAIYTIYNGASMKEAMLAYQKGKPLPEGGRTVRVFSLDGKPLKEYKLDHSISGLWVDEKLGKMWALDVNSDEPIVEYTLK